VNLRAMPSTRRLALLLGGLAMFGPFSIDTIFPAFPQMAAQLGADKLCPCSRPSASTWPPMR